MSEIRATTISDAAGTGPIDLHKQSAAKAWVNFDGSGTVALRDSVNVASITDNGTGNYTVNFSSALANTNYSAVVSSDDSGTSRAFSQSKTYATSSFVATAKRGDTGATVDKDIVSASVHGDLA